MNTAVSQPIHVTHIITDLDTGGAEMMLDRLLGRSCSPAVTHPR